MSLNATTAAAQANNVLQAQIDRLEGGQALLSGADIAKEFAAVYHAYAQQGTLAGADLSAGGTLSLLESAFVADNTPAMAAKIAQGICDYWSSITTPGAPAHGGASVISVVINGGAVLAALTAAIHGLITTAPGDGWQRFYDATDAVVKTIPCTITELMPGSPPYPQDFLEVIA